MGDVIRDLEVRLEPEVLFRAEITGEDPEQARRFLSQNIRSFADQVENRRQFILSEIDKR